MVWAVAKGSFGNKLILVPAALTISAFIPWLIIPLLMIGGAFLCYEGFEKIVHKLLHGKAEKRPPMPKSSRQSVTPQWTWWPLRKRRSKVAIRTDFILSAETIVIALGTVKDTEFVVQAAVVSIIAVLLTVVVYGLVAGVVKMDDAGLHLVQDQAQNAWSQLKRQLGRGLLRVAPWLMKTLSVVGTAAMFLVGGGILIHGISSLHHLVEQL